MRIIARTAVVAAAALALVACQDKNKAAANFDQDMTMGPAKAPVTVIEYASVTCPHCAAFNADVFPAFKSKYIDTGKVHYVFRETPIHGAIDVTGFLLARCAGPDKYFQVIDGIMRAQQQVFATPREAYLSIAQSAGMNEKQFDACESDEAATKKFVERSKAEEDEYNVNSTPTFVINGKTLPPGDTTLDALSAEIDPQLAKK
ncbi:MAG TPA: DsbA family protein [Caulobacteraceae bacterium]|jgi:protein-disulfide isomerase